MFRLRPSFVVVLGLTAMLLAVLATPLCLSLVFDSTVSTTVSNYDSITLPPLEFASVSRCMSFNKHLAALHHSQHSIDASWRVATMYGLEETEQVAKLFKHHCNRRGFLKRNSDSNRVTVPPGRCDGNVCHT